MEENLMLPVLFKLVDQVLDLEADTRLDLGTVALFKHSLEAVVQVVNADDRCLGLVSLLGLLLLRLVLP